MRKYFTLLKIRFINGLQYRIAAFSGILTQVFWGFMNVLLYKAFYESGNITAMAFSDLISYMWLRQAFLIILANWAYDRDIANKVMTGGIAYELTRPMDLYNKWLVESFSNKLAKVSLRAIPIIFLGFIIPKPYGLSLPMSFSSLIMFIIILLISSLIVCAFSMILYILSFYTINTTGLILTFSGIADFLSGAYFPLSLFPKSIGNILYLLPFAYMQDLPLRVYSGDIWGNELLIKLLLQVLWLIILVIIGKTMMSKAIKKTVVQGG